MFFIEAWRTLLTFPSETFKLDGPVVKNPLGNAGDMDSVPGLGRFCVLQGQLSPGTATTELTCHKYWGQRAWEPTLCNESSHHDEKPAHRN